MSEVPTGPTGEDEGQPDDRALATPRSRLPPAVTLLAIAVALVLGYLAGALGRGEGADSRVARGVALLRDPPADGSPRVAQVEGLVLSLDQFMLRWKQLTPETQRFHLNRGGPEHFLDEVTEELLLAEEAIARGYHERPEVVESLRREVNRTLSRPLLGDEVRAKAITEREVRARFELRKGEWEEPAQVRVREIHATPERGPAGLDMVDDATSPEEAEAKIRRLHARLLAGESFSKLAAAESEAPSARYDGLIGWVVEGRFALPYEEEAMALQPGQTSEPIPLEGGGWVLLHAEERREARGSTFEERKAEILEGLLGEDPGAMNRRYRVFIEELKRRHAVRLDPEPLRRAFEDGVEGEGVR